MLTILVETGQEECLGFLGSKSKSVCGLFHLMSSELLDLFGVIGEGEEKAAEKFGCVRDEGEVEGTSSEVEQVENELGVEGEGKGEGESVRGEPFIWDSFKLCFALSCGCKYCCWCCFSSVLT